MRRNAILIFIVTILLMVNYVNQVVKIDYDLNLMEYIAYSKDFTQEELLLLENYGILLFGGNINDPPLGRYFEETGQHLGLTVDIVSALAIELRTNIATKAMVWSEAVEALKNTETNMIDMVPSEARAVDFAFSNPIYRLSGAVLIPDQNSSIHSLKDLDGRTVAVQRSDVVIDKLWSQGIYPNFIYTDHLYDAMDLLTSQQAEAIAGDEPVIRMILNEVQPGGNYTLLDERVYASYTVLAVPKSQSDLLPILNKGILRLRKSGVMTNIEEKWLGTGTTEAQRKSYEKMKHLWLPLAGILAMCFYLIYTWNKRLQSLVDRRTRELRLLADELESAFNSIQAGVLLVDQDGALKQANTVFTQWSGLSEGQNLTESDFGRALSGRLLTKLPDPGENTHEEFQMGAKVYDCSLNTLQTRKDLFLMTVSDVTLDRIRSRKLVHDNKMEAIGRLAAGIAHELRNPLGTIRNSSYLLGTTIEADEDTRTATAAIDRAVNRASQIIDNLLTYARLSSDEQGTLSLPDLISETLSFYKKSMTEHRITPSYIHKGDRQIKSNPSALRHILLNLIHNAIDAMPDGGSLILQSETTISSFTISIEDTGKGIGADQLGNIFEPFYTDKPIGQGTGLGLYIVYTEIQNLGGDIQVKSKAGSGTTFTLNLPAGEAFNHA